MTELPKLSIIIPSVGNKSVLEPTLERIVQAIEGKQVQVIVVDDSRDGKIVDLPRGFELSKTGGQGASFARNKGISLAKGKILLFVDDDIWIRKENIDRTLELHANSKPIGYNFFWVYPKEHTRELGNFKFGNYVLDHELYSNKHRLKGLQITPCMTMNGLTSQYFSIEKKWIDAVGGYDQIPFAGIEDILLFKKLSKIGVQIKLLSTEIIYQDESQRMDIDSLCKRYQTGAFTRRVAVELGHDDVGVQFSWLGRMKGRASRYSFGILKLIARLLPYGVLYRKVVNTLLFASTYKGYYSMSTDKRGKGKDKH